MSRRHRWDRLFASLLETDYQIAIVVTGGGSGSLGWCFGRAGASRNFVDAAIPYSRAAAVSYLGEPLNGPSASAEVADQLAKRACHRAETLSDRSESPAVGIALVAALPTEPPVPAEHRIHVALCDRGQLTTWSLRLPDRGVTRVVAERLAEELIFRAIAHLVDFETDDKLFKQHGLSVDES